MIPKEGGTPPIGQDESNSNNEDQEFDLATFNSIYELKKHAYALYGKFLREGEGALSIYVYPDSSYEAEPVARFTIKRVPGGASSFLDDGRRLVIVGRKNKPTKLKTFSPKSDKSSIVSIEEWLEEIGLNPNSASFSVFKYEKGDEEFASKKEKQDTDKETKTLESGSKTPTEQKIKKSKKAKAKARQIKKQAKAKRRKKPTKKQENQEEIKELYNMLLQLGNPKIPQSEADLILDKLVDILLIDEQLQSVCVNMLLTRPELLGAFSVFFIETSLLPGIKSLSSSSTIRRLREKRRAGFGSRIYLTGEEKSLLRVKILQKIGQKISSQRKRHVLRRKIPEERVKELRLQRVREFGIRKLNSITPEEVLSFGGIPTHIKQYTKGFNISDLKRYMSDEIGAEIVSYLTPKEKAKSKGQKSGADNMYIISSISESPKFSTKYNDCTAVAVSGTDRQTGRQLFLLTHQNPFVLLYRTYYEEFSRDLIETLEEFKSRTIPDSVKVNIAGGMLVDTIKNFLAVDYTEVVETLGLLIKDSLGIEALVTPPSGLYDFDKESGTSKHILLYPEKGDNPALLIVFPKDKTDTQVIFPAFSVREFVEMWENEHREEIRNFFKELKKVKS